MTATRAGKPVRSIAYAHDAADQVVRTRDSHGGSAAYSYDPAGRLTEVCYGMAESAAAPGLRQQPLWRHPHSDG